MKKYIIKRILTGLLVVVVITVLNFFIIHLAPGDPITILAGKNNPSAEMIATLQHKYGLDKPLYIQLINYFKTLLKGDLGWSILYDLPVSKLIIGRLGATAMLVLTSSILAVVLGTLLGLFASRHNNSITDTLVSGVSYFFYSMPSFWLGLMMIMIFASWLKILPTSGMVDLRASSTGIEHIIDILKHLILPVVTLTVIQIPIYFKIFKSSVMHVMAEDFVMTFKATGMSDKKIFRKYIFKNSILPTLTVFGIDLAYLITGAALVEIVFAWPGTGRLMLDAISRRDYPLLMGIYLIMSISIAVIMVILDIVYAAVDPRIRYQ